MTVWGTLPNDALLLGFFPHMHLRGKAFEYTRIRDDGQPETLLRVSPYDFYWQLSYRLAKPMPLRKGTRLEWIATFRQFREQPPQSRSESGGPLWRAELGGDDGRVLRCGGGSPSG